MRKTVNVIAMFLVAIAVAGCAQENKKKDRSGADEMFRRITSLTSNYTTKMAEAPDSAAWSKLCTQFEDSLDKISFAYPPDTDLLLTEGQNDTIHTLMQKYIKERDSRINAILHPVVETDSVMDTDSALVQSPVSESNVISQGGASRSHGN